MNLIFGLIAYTYQERKPSLNLEPLDFVLLPPAAAQARGSVEEPVCVFAKYAKAEHVRNRAQQVIKLLERGEYPSPVEVLAMSK
ncbi:MAG: hypothetical protein AB4040_19545 [Synechococcus sp.]